MNNRRIAWILVTLFVLSTIAVTLGTSDGQTQEKNNPEPEPTPINPYGDLSKYAIADYNASLPENATERQERVKKNKLYDNHHLVLANPPAAADASFVSDAEPVPPAIPVAESELIVVGKILSSAALLSNDKSGVYSEYIIRVETTLKSDKRENRKKGATITVDRTGGIVRYPHGQTMLYLNDWQDLPELGGRYLFFLNRDLNENTNYKILTAYQLNNSKVLALDKHADFHKFNGMSEKDVISLVESKK